jgi:hypothetical protein
VARPLPKGRGGGGATGRRPVPPPLPPLRAKSKFTIHNDKAPNVAACPGAEERRADRAPKVAAGPGAEERRADRTPNIAACSGAGERRADRAPKVAAGPGAEEARAGRAPNIAACSGAEERRADRAPKVAAGPGAEEARATQAPNSTAYPIGAQWVAPKKIKSTGGNSTSAFEECLLKIFWGELNKPAPAPGQAIPDSAISHPGKLGPTPFVHPGCRTHDPQISRANLPCSS